MKFPAPLLEGTLIRRYKRFLADIRLADGTLVTAHTPNTGAMTDCNVPGSRVWLRQSGNPRRKYPLSWELVEAPGGALVGINTTLANRLVREAIENGVIAELQGYSGLRTEAAYGEENSRIDLLLDKGDGRRCFVEVKNVTLVENGIALFPDAVSKRGAKHLRELAAMVRQEQRGVIFFCVQRQDAGEVRPADAIDAAYGLTLRQALAQGVEALAYDCRVAPSAIEVRRPLPVSCPALS
ncbi:MAG: DNA/RNA nuclease SfsA [Gammaproteobacteria bacterium]